jgi:hypothetical protein
LLDNTRRRNEKKKEHEGKETDYAKKKNPAQKNLKDDDNTLHYALLMYGKEAGFQ